MANQLEYSWGPHTFIKPSQQLGNAGESYDMNLVRRGDFETVGGRADNAACGVERFRSGRSARRQGGSRSNLCRLVRFLMMDLVVLVLIICFPIISALIPILMR